MIVGSLCLGAAALRSFGVCKGRGKTALECIQALNQLATANKVTSIHLLCECKALAEYRRKLLGSDMVETTTIKKTKYSILLNFYYYFIFIIIV